LHAGPQLLMATIRQTYWINGARDLIRRFIHKCVTWRRQRAETMQQIMGSLPSDRITSGARAFVKIGVDFAGPVLLKTGRGRGSRTEKAWIALFVCLAVKAIHLELVTSLITEAFIATLKRFITRRGPDLKLYTAIMVLISLALTRNYVVLSLQKSTMTRLQHIYNKTTLIGTSSRRKEVTSEVCGRLE